MQGEPAEPTPRELDLDDANDPGGLLCRRIAQLRRWVEWELWLYEPRSFAAPEESGIEHPVPPAGAEKPD